MSKNNNNSTNGGVGFVGLLTIVFIALKLIGVINWSWVWVLSPVWIATSIGFAVIGIAFIVYAIKESRK